jgi:hypothetical protein
MDEAQGDLRAAVRRLEDRQAIADCLADYARGIDRADRELLRSSFHDDARVDYGFFVGDAERFVDWVLPMHARTHLSHQHCLMNSRCEIDGDEAHAETYFMFVGLNRRGRPMSVSGGRYIDRLARRDDRWAIVTRLCVRDWAPVDQPLEALSQVALTITPLADDMRALMLSGPEVSRSPEDPSYLRPLVVGDDRLGDS